MLACDDIMPSGWTPAAASSTLEDWTRTSSRGQQCSCFTITVRYSTEFGWDSRKFASGVRKYGKFSHFLTHLVVYGGQGQKQILSSLSTANVYRLSRRGLSTLSHRGGRLRSLRGWPCQRGRSTFKCDTNVNDKHYEVQTAT